MKKKCFSDRLKYLGDVFKEADKWHIWCTSAIDGPDGKVHLFVARWPLETGHQGWTTHSEIAHAVSDTPNGLFKFTDVVLNGKRTDVWNAQAPHNPTIHKIDDKYVIFYIARYKGSGPEGQNIGMLISDSLFGPWKESSSEPILARSDDPTDWDYKSCVGVNNPAFLKHPNGEYWLYYKAKPKGADIGNSNKPRKMGLAVSRTLQGPYVRLKQPVASSKTEIEDAYAFIENGTFHLITTDNNGAVKRGGGLLFSSNDGTHFDKFEMGFNTACSYEGTGVDKEPWELPSDQLGKFERPQILMRDGKPAYLYTATGKNFVIEHSKVNYYIKGSSSCVFKIMDVEN